MKRHRAVKSLALTFLWLPAMSSFAATENRIQSLTLETTVRAAVLAATTILKAKNATDVSGSALIQGYAQFLPNLVGTASYGYSAGQNLFTTQGITNSFVAGTSAKYQISSDLNIFNGLSDYSSLRSFMAKNNATVLTLKRAEQQIALDITQTFLQVILDEKLEEISTTNLKASTDRLELFRERRRLGSIASADLYRQEALTAADRSSLIQATAKRKDDLILLIRKIRLDAKKDYALVMPDLTPKESILSRRDEFELIRMALEERRDLAATHEVTEGFEWDTKTAMSPYYPHLDLLGTYGAGGQFVNSQYINGATSPLPPQNDLMSNQLPNQTGYSLMLNLTWTIFDRMATPYNTAKNDIVAKNAKLDEEDLKNQVIGEVRQALLDYHSAAEQLASAKAGTESAEKAYELINGRYKAGVVSFIDLATSQASLVQAQSSLAQALITYRLQGEALNYFTGNNVSWEP